MALPLRATLIALAAGAGLTGCTSYDDYGYGPGYGYNVGVSYGNGYYYPSRYAGSRYNAGYPYYGWYGDYYYPGTGVYVYDAYRRPYVWNDNQRIYWEGRRDYRGGGQYRDNWNDFRRDRRDGRRDGRGWRRRSR